MKVYLLNPPYYPHFGRSMRWQDVGRAGTLYYPIWLAYAAAALEAENEVRLVDAPAWGWGLKEIVADANKFCPNIIVIDTSFPSLSNDIAVAGSLKQSCPEAKVVIVGPPASQLADNILGSPCIDIVARWEYEFTLQELVRELEGHGNIKDIKGISYQQNGQVVHNPEREFSNSEDLDGLPFVSKVYKKYLHIEDYFLSSSLYPEVQIFTGRGCPFRCTFCSWTQTLTGRNYRVRSITSVLDEFQWIQDNLPQVKEIFLEDDTFTIDNERVLEFTLGYAERRLKANWACNARVGLGYEVMKTMKKANCRLVIVGYESGSDTVLKNIKKGITVEQTKQFAKDARRAGLLVHGDFVIGLPGETRETIDLTKRLIAEVKPDILQVSVATPFPGTELYQWAKTNGYLLTDDPNEYLDEQGHQKSIMSYPQLTAGDIARTADNILKEYYLSVKYVPIALRQLFRRNGIQEMSRLWHSARIFIVDYVWKRRG